MPEPIEVDFRRRARVPTARSLSSIATQVRMFLDRATTNEYAVDVVLPDPKRDRTPFIQVSMPIVDADLEDLIERGWPTTDFDFVWCDPEDLP